MHGWAPEEEVLAGGFAAPTQGACPVPAWPGVGDERRRAFAALVTKQPCGPLCPMCGNVSWRQAGPAPGNARLTVLRRAPCAPNVRGSAAAADPRCDKALCVGARSGRPVQPTAEDAANVRCG
eukprot:3154664-Alexandrium_andersonii.AAC.1